MREYKIGREGNEKRGYANRMTCDSKRNVDTCQYDTHKWGKGFGQDHLDPYLSIPYPQLMWVDMTCAIT